MQAEIKLHPIASQLAASGAGRSVPIAGYAVARHDGILAIAPTMGSDDVVHVPERDISYHVDADEGPSTYYVRADAEVTIHVRRTAEALTKSAGGCSCAGPEAAEPADDAAALRPKGRSDAIRNATCLGRFIGCSIACLGERYPEICQQACANAYSRCTTPIFES